MEISNDISSKILERLRDWEEKGVQLPGYLQLYQEVVSIQSGVPYWEIVRKPDLDAGIICDRVREGIPLISFEEFKLDWQQVQKIFGQVVIWLDKDSIGPLCEADALRNISQDISLLQTITGAWYRRHYMSHIQGAENIDHNLLTFVVATTLKPFLFAYSRRLLAELDQELWCRRYCPICGGVPDFSYLDKESGARWLVCSRCDAEWLFLRLTCPYCGTQNQNALSYFTDEEDSCLYRLYICEQCHTYIKAIDLRRAQQGVLLPLERLMTLEMDKVALEKGYRPGWSDLTEAVRLKS